jgi:Flp pilus assembly protein TadD
VSLDGGSAQGYYYLALANALDGRLEIAAEFFRHCLDINPSDFRVLRDSAMVYLAMGRVSQASEQLRQAKSLKGEDSLIQMLQRKVWLGRAKERIRDFFGRLRRQMPIN